MCMKYNVGQITSKKCSKYSVYNIRSNSVNSRLQVLGGGEGNTYLGGKFYTFFNVFCILGVFLGGGNLGFWGGGIPPPGDSWK